MDIHMKKIVHLISTLLLLPATHSQYYNETHGLHPAALVRSGNEVWCGGRLCGTSNEMQCCSFDPLNCCNKNNQYCNEQSCGMINDGWYCGTCNSFNGSTCCNDQLTICQAKVCGHKEDYECCDVDMRCCVIIPPEPAPTPIYATWWFWVGLLFCGGLLFFIGFVLWSDRLFIKYNIDKARGLNPQPPPGMPFHRRASTRLRSSFRASRQAVHRASVRMSQRRRRTGPRARGAANSTDRPEVTHISGPPPFVNGPTSLRSRQPPPSPPSQDESVGEAGPSRSVGESPSGRSYGEPPPPYSPDVSGDTSSALPFSHGNLPPGDRKQFPPISPAHDLTPRSEVKRQAPKSFQNGVRSEQVHNPATNPTFDPSRPATFSQPRYPGPEAHNPIFTSNGVQPHPGTSRIPPHNPNYPQHSPGYSGGYGPRGPPLPNQRGPPPHNVRGPPPQPHDPRRPVPQFSRGPPPQNVRGPPPQNVRGPPPQNIRGPPPQNVRGPPPQNVRGPPPNIIRGPPPQPMGGPVPQNVRGPPPLDVGGSPPYNGRGPHPQNMRGPPGYQGYQRGPPPPNRSRAPMPPGYGGAPSYQMRDQGSHMEETII